MAEEMQKMEALQRMFVTFCSFGTSKKLEEMDGAKFAKFCRDAGIIDKKCTPTDVDLIYTKIKGKTARKINFKEFSSALDLLAEKKGVTRDAVIGMALSAGGPTSSGTQADAVKFHDDKSLYTGVHKAGGPSTVDNHPTLESLADRSASDIRGRKIEVDNKGFDKADKGQHRQVEKSAPSASGGSLQRRPSLEKGKSKSITSKGTYSSIEDVYETFANFGSGAVRTPAKLVNMDGGKFAKFCRDGGLLDKQFTATAVDLIFSKVKPKGDRKINYDEFVQALELIAEAKGISMDDLKHQIMGAGGPSSSGTVPDAVKFHDDKSLYTGVHARGGPTTVDNKITLSNLADRSPSDIRGRKM